MKEQDLKDKEDQGEIKQKNPVDVELNLASEIEKNKKAAIREKIVETTLDKLQGPAKGSVAKNLAESKFSRRLEDMELL